MFWPLVGRVPLGHLWYLLRRMRSELPHRFAGLTRVNTFFPPHPSPAFGRFCQAVIQRRRVPFSAYLAVTSRCPYRCEHCSLAGRDGGEMDREQVLGLIEQIKGLGTCTLGLTGGEPLLREDLEEFVRAAGPEMTTVVFTTGYGLDDQRAGRLAQAGVTCVTVGIESDDPDKQAKVRGEERSLAPARDGGRDGDGGAVEAAERQAGAEAGGAECKSGVSGTTFDRTPATRRDRHDATPRDGSWEQARRAVEACRRAGIYPAISTIGTADKLRGGELERMHELGGRWGAGEFRVLAPVATGGWSGRPSAMLSPAELAELADFHVRMNRRRVLPAVACFAYLESAEMFGCGAGYHHLFIDPSGEVCPCDLTPLSMGSALARPLGEIWAQMGELFARPRRSCLMRELAGRVRAPLPMPAQASQELCRLCRHSGELPEGYRRLL